MVGMLVDMITKYHKQFPQQECIQIDTTNILFICGGAFVGLEKIVEKRKDNKSLGFGSNVRTKKDYDGAELLKEIQPDDLIKYGLIPEFAGRLPIVVGLTALDEEALVKILTCPKNALTKQYRKLLELDGVELEFSDDAIHAIAQRAIKLNTGARGLRAIVESAMLDIMYDIPTQKDVEKIVVTRETIESKEKPLIVRKKTVSAEEIA